MSQAHRPYSFVGRLDYQESTFGYLGGNSVTLLRGLFDELLSGTLEAFHLVI
jgi:hypothetical protein